MVEALKKIKPEFNLIKIGLGLELKVNLKL